MLQPHFFPQYVPGYLGMPRRYHSYAPEFQVLNVLSSAGSSILAVAYLLPLFYLLWSLLLAAGMITVIALLFMNLWQSPVLTRIFALGGLFWLAVLFGLAGADCLTRVLYPAPT